MKQITEMLSHSKEHLQKFPKHKLRIDSTKNLGVQLYIPQTMFAKLEVLV